MSELTKPVPTSIAFERRYSDDSGVEMAVRLEGESIQFERIETVDFPVSELDWLIQTLMYIYCQIGGPRPRNQTMPANPTSGQGVVAVTLSPDEQLTVRRLQAVVNAGFAPRPDAAHVNDVKDGLALIHRIAHAKEQAAGVTDLVREWERLEQAFHDGLPAGQGETGDGGVAGRALCQFLYDNSEKLRAALAPAPASSAPIPYFEYDPDEDPDYPERLAAARKSPAPASSVGEGQIAESANCSAPERAPAPADAALVGAAQAVVTEARTMSMTMRRRAVFNSLEAALRSPDDLTKGRATPEHGELASLVEAAFREGLETGYQCGMANETPSGDAWERSDAIHALQKLSASSGGEVQ